MPTNKPADNQDMINQIDAYIDGLNMPAGTTVATAVVTKSVGLPPSNMPTKVVPPSTDEEMKAFILKHSAVLVENSVGSILELQKATIATGDPEMMSALAGLIAASTTAIEAVSKLHLQNKKFEDAKELRKLDIEGRKEVQKLKNEGLAEAAPSQLNVLVATREEIIAELTGKAKNKPVTEVYDLPTIGTVTLSA